MHCFRLNDSPGIDRKSRLISIDDEVKISNGFERFWVDVTSIDGDFLKGIVANELIFPKNYGYDFGSEISFKRQNILDIIFS